jgi:hypothetical protein
MHRWLSLGLLAFACGGSSGQPIRQPGVPSTCSTIVDFPGCDQGASSYACSAGRPDVTTAGSGDGLACSGGEVFGSDTTYFCCIEVTTALAGCAPLQLAGCADASIALSCTGDTAPGSAEATLACSAPMSGSAGADIYCCTTGVIPSACMQEPSLACTGYGIGYDCSGSATPGDDNAAVTCTAANGSAANGDTEFCCAPT